MGNLWRSGNQKIRKTPPYYLCSARRVPLPLLSTFPLDTNNGDIAVLFDIFADILDEPYRVSKFDVDVGVEIFEE